jgi:hypothetical protein
MDFLLPLYEEKNTMMMSAHKSWGLGAIATFVAALLVVSSLACTVEEEPEENNVNNTANNTVPDMEAPKPDMDAPKPDMDSPQPDMDVTPDMPDEPDMAPDMMVVTQSAFKITTAGTVAVDPAMPFTSIKLDGIPTQSYGREILTFTNTSDKAIKLDDLSITTKDAHGVNQWYLMNYNDPNIGNFIYETVDVSGKELAPGESLALEVVIYVVHFGVSEALISLEYDGGKKQELTVQGRGRQHTVFTPAFTTQKEWVFSHSAKFLETNGMVLDQQDNYVLSVSAREWIDRFAPDYSISSISPTGELRWAKVFDGGYRDGVDSAVERDPGGVSRSVEVASDGFIYAVGETSLGTQNNLFRALILKIDPANGDIVWARTWQPEPTSGGGQVREGARAASVDTSLPDRIIVSGSAGSPARLFVLAINKSTGDVIFQKALKTPGTNVKTIAMRVAPDGSGYISNLGNGQGYLVRLTGLNGAAPAIDWARNLGLGGQSSNIHDLAIDADGNAYAAIDIRGASTTGLVARINKTGATAWANRYNTQSASSSNKTFAITVDGGKVYIGGSIGISPFGTVGGDGLLMRVDAADGKYDWGAFYYNGVGIKLRTSSAVRSIHVKNGIAKLAFSANTASDNTFHYGGYWYGLPNYVDPAMPPGDGSERQEEDVTFEPANATGFIIEEWADRGGPSYLTPDTSMTWQNAPRAVGVKAIDEMTGPGGHKMALIMELLIK